VGGQKQQQGSGHVGGRGLDRFVAG
jgi:hypothetical protein